ncbi:nuclear transport factor 2 family protein [Brevundimonas poindexterae]|uniref:nuclear transport factor 2 family protein n=1 Tax=Brevundimonas poindexterae TaxID=74325 RepID=UPI001CFF15DA|nr:nuclear transport factor 2 family protein [Brevundimonas poindexterae]
MTLKARTIVERSLAAIEMGDHDVLEACLHPQVIYRRPGQPVLSGREAVVDYYRRHRSAKTSQILIDDMVCEGDRVVAMGLVEGRGHDGAPIHERFADAYRLEGGLIRERTTYFFRQGF